MILIPDIIAREKPKEFDTLVRVMHLFHDDTQKYYEIVEQCKRFVNEMAYRSLIDGAFNLKELHLLVAMANGGSANSEIVKYLLMSAVDCGLITDQRRAAPYTESDYYFTFMTILVFDRIDLIDTALARHSLYTINKFRNCVFGIAVILKDGSEHLGTGFAFRLADPFDASTQRTVLVTAMHNIDPAQGIRVKEVIDSAGNVVPMRGDWVLNPSLDAAYLDTRDLDHIPVAFRATDRADLLTETIMMGYPRVPHATSNPLVSTTGQYIGDVDLMWPRKRLMLVSNQSAPGASGGPIISKYGSLIGMVRQNIEAQYNAQSDVTKFMFLAAEYGPDIIHFIASNLNITRVCVENLSAKFRDSDRI